MVNFMNKKVIKTILIVCILLILLLSYFILQNGVVYRSKIKNINNIKISELQIQKEQFEMVNQYCTKSNKNSSNPFIFYNEFLVVELNTDNKFDLKTFIDANSFVVCTDESDIKNTLSGLSNENNEWMRKIIDDTTWYQTTCQFEDKHIKSSVNLYLISTNSSTIYIILDQRYI